MHFGSPQSKAGCRGAGRERAPPSGSNKCRRGAGQLLLGDAGQRRGRTQVSGLGPRQGALNFSGGSKVDQMKRTRGGGLAIVTPCTLQAPHSAQQMKTL